MNLHQFSGKNNQIECRMEVFLFESKMKDKVVGCTRESILGVSVWVMPPRGLLSSMQHHTSIHQDFHSKAPDMLVRQLCVSAEQRFIFASGRRWKKLSWEISRSKWRSRVWKVYCDKTHFAATLLADKRKTPLVRTPRRLWTIWRRGGFSTCRWSVDALFLRKMNEWKSGNNLGTICSMCRHPC